MANGRPPFELPNNIRNASSYKWVQKMMLDFSDGDRVTWPSAQYRPSSDAYYLCYLAQEWAKTTETVPPGIHYYLDKLPTGYSMLEIDQPGGGQTYKRLFGHPSGKFYDSAPTFLPHFLWLVDGMKGTCECKKCSKPAPKVTAPRQFVPRPRAPLEFTVNTFHPGVQRTARKDSDDNDSTRSNSADGIATRRAQRQVKQAGAPYAQDEEGNEDIYKDCVNKLLLQKNSTHGIEFDLKEENSIDWISEREPIQRHLAQIERQHTFVPRVGELVLWCPMFSDDHYLMRQPATGEYQFYSFEDKRFHGSPAWRGGIVAAAPTELTENGLLDFPDVLDAPMKKTTLNTAGFRIETMPDPNDDLDKSFSKQYKYVPLRNVRPLSQWQILLKGISPKKLHPSILYALTCMTSISLMEKWRFIGDWPIGRIFCRGIYIGCELITVGDTVRLLKLDEDDEDRSASCTDILIVSSIRYNLIDMLPDHAAPNTAQLSDRSYISLVGQAYTTDAGRAFGTPFVDDSQRTDRPGAIPVSHEEVKSMFRAVGADEYGPWYPLHGPKERFEASHEQVLGKLYEADAVRLWTGQRQAHPTDRATFKPSLDFDADSVIAGRRYATAADGRLPEPQSSSETNWFLSDTRAQGLAIATLNGLEVGKHHRIRDPATLRHWRAQVKLADGREIGPELQQELIDATARVHRPQADIIKRRGRPPGTRIINGKAYYAGDPIPEGITDYEDDTPTRAKPSSQKMIEAGLNSETDDASNPNDDNNDEDDEYTIEIDAGYPIKSIEHLKSLSISNKPPPPTSKPTSTTQAQTHTHQPNPQVSPPKPKTSTKIPFSKTEIMTSLDNANSAMTYDDEHSDSEDEFDFLREPIPIRGGTEESEGGDYRGGD